MNIKEVYHVNSSPFDLNRFMVLEFEADCLESEDTVDPQTAIAINKEEEKYRRRIEVCLNACQGVRDKHLTQGIMKEVIVLLGEVVEWSENMGIDPGQDSAVFFFVEEMYHRLTGRNA